MKILEDRKQFKAYIKDQVKQGKKPFEKSKETIQRLSQQEEIDTWELLKLKLETNEIASQIVPSEWLFKKFVFDSWIDISMYTNPNIKTIKELFAVLDVIEQKGLK